MGVSIDRPAQGEQTAVAVMGSGSGPGVICARGPVGEASGNLARNLAVSVCAYIYSGFVDGDADPPAGRTCYVPVGDDWYFAALAVPTCTRSTPYPKYTLKVWAVAGGVTLSSDKSQFYAKCAGQVDCGTGPSQAPAAPFGAGVQAIVAGLLATAPLQWILTFAGAAEGIFAAFNGSWPLRLRPGMDGHCVWDNGGDGDETALVELRCEGPLYASWQLNLRHRGAAASYTKPAAEWNSLAANTFTAPAPRNGTVSERPAFVVVEPC